MTIRTLRRLPWLLAAVAVAVTVRAQTGGPPKRNIAGPGDYGLRQKIVGLLGRDPDLNGEKYGVVLVNGGVILSGPIKTCALKMRALRIAASIRGVINVTDEMRVAPADLPDEALRQAVQGALQNKAEEIGLQGFSATVADGVATIEGTVKDFAARVRGEEIVGSILGITRISNHLFPAGVPAGTDDPSLVKAVVGCLGDYRNFPYPAQIMVKAGGGVVTLNGRVSLFMGRQQAGVLASLIKGVARVDNRLRVDPSLPGVGPLGATVTVVKAQP